VRSEIASRPSCLDELSSNFHVFMLARLYRTLLRVVQPWQRKHPYAITNRRRTGSVGVCFSNTSAPESVYRDFVEKPCFSVSSGHRKREQRVESYFFFLVQRLDTLPTNFIRLHFEISCYKRFRFIYLRTEWSRRIPFLFRNRYLSAYFAVEQIINFNSCSLRRNRFFIALLFGDIKHFFFLIIKIKNLILTNQS